MAARDDLNDPLGLGSPPRPKAPLRLFASAGAALLVVGAISWIGLRGDPLGGEPHAVAVIVPAEPPHKAAAPAPARPQAADLGDVTGSIAPAPAEDSAAELEEKSGVKVVRSGGGNPPGALIIDVPQLLAQRLAPAPDPSLVEKSRYGLLPRIGADGARPADVYAKHWSAPAPLANAPRVAIVVGGVGLSDSATAQAIDDLPGVITLAFAPYGDDLKGKVTRARQSGHEVILQLPMEPIDYPRTNPGPHMLRAGASAAENADDLHWLLARFSGYVGVSNFLGAKFLSANTAFEPLLQEINDRGLIYLDDGSTPRSAGLALAKSIGLPAARADVILDAVATGADPTQTMDANLVKLETIARAKGFAIGMASDLPNSLENLARFAHQAEARGLALVPLSVAVRIAATAEVTSATGRDPHAREP